MSSGRNDEWTHCLQLLLRLCLHLPDVVHAEPHPLINGTKKLPVKVGEDPLLLLRMTATVALERTDAGWDNNHDRCGPDLVDEILHFGLQTPPLELDCN